jgi:hypothetical protein
LSPAAPSVSLPPHLRRHAKDGTNALPDEHTSLARERITDVDFETKVVGVTRHNHDGSDRQVIAKDCRPGDPIVLRHEPDNAQDANAVAVYRENGEQVGYLSAAVAEKIAPLLDADAPLTAIVSAVTGGTPDHPNYGVDLRIHDGEVDASPAAASTDPGERAPVRKHAAATPRPESAPAARRGCASAAAVIIGGLVTWTVLLTVTFWTMR